MVGVAPKPTRDQFLDKLRGVEMTVRSATHPFEDSNAESSRGVVNWLVTGAICLFTDEDGDDTELWGQPGLGLGDARQIDDGELQLPIFHTGGVTVHLTQVADAWAVLEARDVGSGAFAALIDRETGYLRDDLSVYDDDAEAASSLVIIDRARIADRWRGQGGIGRLLIEQAISLVAQPAGMSMAALEAHPYLDQVDDPVASPEAIAATERIWASLGFTRVDNGRLFIRSTARENLFDEVAQRLGLS